MQAIRKIINSDKIKNIINLPSNLKHKMVVVTVSPVEKPLLTNKHATKQNVLLKLKSMQIDMAYIDEKKELSSFRELKYENTN